MEVEHFVDKDRSPDDVVNWENLLPSCKRCNSSKGTHNVCSEPIVNPYALDPRDHFWFRLYRFRGKSSTGSTSIDILDLNNQLRAVQVRFEIGERISEQLLTAEEMLTRFKENSATRTKNRLIGQLQAILTECQPNSQYAATAATVLHSDKIYSILIKELRQLGLWNCTLQELHDNSTAIALDTI